VLDKYFATRRWLKVGLVIAGAVAGAVIGVVVTYLGKIVSGAPPATLANYVINARVFAVVGAVFTPVVVWSGLQRVPLWRTVLEPLAAGIVGAAIGVALGSGILFLVLIPVGIGGAATRLALSHRERSFALPRRV
jgi:predicted Na+-dependent transporter